MKKVGLSLAIAIVIAYVFAVLIPINPEEQRPGTSLSGNIVPEVEIDWSFLPSRTQIYVQTNTWYGIPHSVTTTSFVDNGVLYVPCARCDSKRWPKNVASDPNVFVKVGESLYPRSAELVTDMAIKHRILNERHQEVALYRMNPPLP